MRIRIVIAVACVLFSVLGNTAEAAKYWDVAGVGAWETFGNWTTNSTHTNPFSEPVVNDTTIIGDSYKSGTAQITLAGEVARRIWIASGPTSSVGTLEIFDGTSLTVGGTESMEADSGYLQVGSSGTGTVNQYGGTVTVGYTDAHDGNLDMAVGSSAIGTYNMTGGTLTVRDAVTTGAGSSTINIDNGTMTVGEGFEVDNLRIGYNDGTGSLTVNDGAVSAGSGTSSAMDIGRSDASGAGNGTANFSSATSVNINVGDLRLGTVSSGGTGGTLGTLMLSAAGNNTVTVNSVLMGDSPDSGNEGVTTTMSLGAAANDFNANTFTVAGRKSRAEVSIAAGGTLTLAGNTVAEADLRVGYNSAATGSNARGTLDLSGGTFNATLDDLVIGYHQRPYQSGGSGTGILTFEQGIVTADTVTIGDAGVVPSGTYAGNEGMGDGTLNMGGDSLSANAVTLGTGTTRSVGTINQTGGTIDVSGSVSDGVGTSTINIDNGTMTVGTGFSVDSLRIGYNDGTGALATTDSAGSLTVSTGAVKVGNSTTDRGTLEMGLNTAGTIYDASATLDLSTATQFDAFLDTLTIGKVTESASTGRGWGTLTLAPLNNIDAGEILVSWSNMHATAQQYSTIKLGAANNINVDTLTVGGRRCRATMEFAAAGGTLTLDSSNPAQSGTDLRVAYTDLDTGSSGTATMDLSGGTFNATLRDVVIGHHQSKTGTDTGTLTFDAGTITAETLTIGSAGVSGNGKANGKGTMNMNGDSFTVGSTVLGTGTGNGTGTINLGGGTFTTNSLALGAGVNHATYGDGKGVGTLAVSNGLVQVNGNATLGSGTASSSGTINQTGGTITISGSVVDGVGTGTLNVDGGTMTVDGDLKIDYARVGYNGRNGSVTAGGDVEIGASGTLDVGRRDDNTVNADAATVGTLDLSGANSVSFTLDELRVGTVATDTSGSTTSTLTLSTAGTSTIDATAITVGHMASGPTPTTRGYLHLGGDNTIQTDALYVGRQKAKGDADILSGGTLTLSGLSGAEANLYVGYNDSQTTSNVAVGNMNLNGGTFNATLDEVIVGYHVHAWSNTDSGSGTGTLSFDDGTVNANTVTVGKAEIHPTYDRHGRGVGTLNVAGNAELNADSILLAMGSNRTEGTVNLSGGTITAGLIDDGIGTAEFNFTGGTLHVDTFGFTLVQDGGVLDAEGSPGLTRIVGDYIQNGGILHVDITGDDPGDQDPAPPGDDDIGFDLYVVEGAALLDGIVRVDLQGGYWPAFGTTFDVLTAESLSSTSGSIAVEYFVGGGDTARSTFRADIVDITGGQALRLTSLMPEPATLLIWSLLAGLGMGLGWRRRK